MKLRHGLMYDRQCDEGFDNLDSYGRTRRLAYHALCFMLKGILKKWKINIAYFLTQSIIKAEILFKLVKEIIEKSTKSD